MNRIQKATASAVALAITLVGATLVTAPMALADSQQVVAQAQHWSAGHIHRIATDLRYAASSAQA
jgi:hypothetical protein